MTRHLTAQQMEEWVIGQHTPSLDAHLQVCRECAEEVARIEGPLKLFGSAVREWSANTGPTRATVPLESGWSSLSRGRIGRLALATAALFVIIAVPVYRREEATREAAAAAVAAQDEILLRQVERGISRSVPAPMEPLARLMSSDLSR